MLLWLWWLWGNKRGIHTFTPSAPKSFASHHNPCITVACAQQSKTASVVNNNTVFIEFVWQWLCCCCTCFVYNARVVTPAFCVCFSEKLFIPTIFGYSCLAVIPIYRSPLSVRKVVVGCVTSDSPLLQSSCKTTLNCNNNSRSREHFFPCGARLFSEGRAPRFRGNTHNVGVGPRKNNTKNPPQQQTAQTVNPFCCIVLLPSLP